MVQISTNSEKEIWVKIDATKILTDDIVAIIDSKIRVLLPGFSAVYISLKQIQSIKSSAIIQLRKMISSYMEMGCSVKFGSVDDKLGDIIESLTISSDG